MAATACKRLGCYPVGGPEALAHAVVARPIRSSRGIAPAKALLIGELRHWRMTQARIAYNVGVSDSTISLVLARAGLSKLRYLAPPERVERYEHERPGDLLHIDIKKLGRIERPRHRVTGNRATRSRAPAGRCYSWR